MTRHLVAATLLISAVAWAQPTPEPSPATDAPRAEPAPSLVPRGADDAPEVFPPGKLPPGRSVKLRAGDPAPYGGWLLDHQEAVRRERRDAGNAAELASYKDPGNVTQTRVQFILIVAGVGVAAAVAATAVTVAAYEAAKPKP